MLKKRLRRRPRGAVGHGEGGTSRDALMRGALNDRTDGATGLALVQSTPLQKYRETEGIKDVKSDSYTASKIQTIDKTQWEDYGNAQGATSVIKRLAATGTSKRLPANPTRVTSVTVRNQGSSVITIAPGSTATLPVVSPTLYDCSTWAYYYATDDVQYDYVGYFASAHSKTEETKTVLAQSGSTAMQNFAFDIDE